MLIIYFKIKNSPPVKLWWKKKRNPEKKFNFFGLALPPAKFWHWTVEFIYEKQNTKVQKGFSYHIILFEWNNKMRIKNTMNYDQQFSFITTLFSDTCRHTKNKSRRRCRLYFRGRVGGFLILKQTTYIYLNFIFNGWRVPTFGRNFITDALANIRKIIIPPNKKKSISSNGFLFLFSQHKHLS
jgi:hypothetical protein